MNAYTTTITKKEFVKELKAHQKADNFIRGSYWNKQEMKGCAVGCSLESISRTKKLGLNGFTNHGLYETHLGIPEWLARVEDTLFEGLPIKCAKTWPVEFAQAIHVGADLEKAKAPFLIFILKSTLDKFDHAKYPDVKKAVDRSIALWERDDIGSASWNAAAARAAAAWAAEYEKFADELLRILRGIKPLAEVKKK